MRLSKRSDNTTGAGGIRNYMHEVRKTTVLSAAEEAELSRKIKAGDTRALDKLVKANLRFVVAIAAKYKNCSLDMEDLISEGNLGLIRAAQKFDEARGFRFTTYAMWWIKQAILQALNEHSRIIRIPGNKIKTHNKIAKALHAFEQAHYREPSHDELMEILGMTQDAINGYFIARAPTFPADAMMGEDEDGGLVDIIYDKDEKSAEDHLTDVAVQQALQKAVSSLSLRESEIISHHYGLNDRSPMSLQELGDNFGYPVDKIRYIREKSIRKLKAVTNGHLLQNYAA